MNASVVTRRVSGETSTEKPRVSAWVAVRHTPLTATLSPGCSSPPSAVSTRNRRDPPSGTTSAIRPVASISPVNIKLCQRVVAQLDRADLPALAEPRELRRGHALPQPPRGRHALHAVDQIRPPEGHLQRRAAFNQQRHHADAGEPTKYVAEIAVVKCLDD